MIPNLRGKTQYGLYAGESHVSAVRLICSTMAPPPVWHWHRAMSIMTWLIIGNSSTTRPYWPWSKCARCQSKCILVQQLMSTKEKPNLSRPLGHRAGTTGYLFDTCKSIYTKYEAWSHCTKILMSLNSCLFSPTLHWTALLPQVFIWSGDKRLKCKWNFFF